MSQATTPQRLPGTGWRKDVPQDRRDRALYAAVPDISNLPERVDLEHLLPPVMDQSVVGACTGYGAANVAYAIMKKDGHRRPFVPSPVFLYLQARKRQGWQAEDSGAYVRDVWWGMNHFGLPPMSNIKPRFKRGDLPDPNTWIFPEQSIWRREPAPSHYADAERRQMVSYFRLQFVEDMLRCLADGFPFCFGIPIFRSFYGLGGPLYDIPDPQPGERDLGGHCITGFGYDLRRQRVICRNSWGPEAHQGSPNFTLSLDYMRRFASDAWTGRWAEGGKVAA